MQLQGQAKIARQSESGYAMAVLLVAMGVMAVMLSAAMPVWKHIAQREKEDELIFRGTQYVHAIGLFQRKYMNAYPPNVDVLVEQRFLRKKFKDPITNDDFQPLGAGQVVPGTLQDRVVNGPGQLNTQPAQGAGGRGGTASTAGRGGATGATTTGPGASTGGTSPASPGSPGSTFSTTGPGGSSTPGAGGVAGIMGVVSKSKDKSIRIYNGRTHYNEWAFVFQAQQQVPGGGVPGSTVPGQAPVQPGQQPGQRGQQPFGPGQRGIIPSIERGSPFAPGGPGRGVPPGGVNPFSPQPSVPIQPPPQPGRGRAGG
jgi:type II secretory pathway pseudopilin PulG